MNSGVISVASLGLALFSSVPTAAFVSDQQGILQQYEATILSVDPGTKNKLLFNEHRTVRQEGKQTVVEIRTTDPKGQLALSEVLKYENGRLESYLLDRKQISASGTVTIKGKKVFYEYRKTGVVEKEEEPFSDALIASDQVDSMILKNLDRFKRMEPLTLSLMVPNQTKSIEFQITQQPDQIKNNEKVWVFKMEPTSFIISLAVRPAWIYLRALAPHQRIEYVGRKFLKIEKNGTWQDLDARTVYHYIEAAAAAAKPPSIAEPLTRPEDSHFRKASGKQPR